MAKLEGIIYTALRSYIVLRGFAPIGGLARISKKPASYQRDAEEAKMTLIAEKLLYYVLAALGKGSINLVSGFEKTKYLLLHNEKVRLLVRLKGEGPRFFPLLALDAL